MYALKFEVYMRIVKIIFSVLVILPFSSNLFALSLGDVHHQVRITVTEIEALKTHYAADVTSRVPGIQVGKTTVHAYIKALELLEKIQKFQRQKKLPELSVPSLPRKRVRSKNILAVVDLAQTELIKITKGLNLTAKSFKEDNTSKTASDVYEVIWQASYLMDALIAPITPNEVMRNAKMIEGGLIDIAERMNKPIEFVALRTFTDKQPVDVTISLFKLLYKLAKIERKIKLKPLVVPTFPAGEIKPEDAFDASGNVIADLTRIALKLKIAPMTKVDAVITKVTPNHVYAQVVRLNQAAELLLK